MNFASKLTVTLCIAVINLAFAQVNIKPAPKWVDQTIYNAQPNINTNDIEQGKLLLLTDSQFNVAKQEIYYRSVIKITDNVGVQNASDISASYDPKYQKLAFNNLTIIRDGKTINKLKANDFQVIRRELNAENYLYDGSLTAMCNITDVRTGDIIDYSYTISGFNPIHNNKFSAMYYLNDYVPVGKVNLSILTNTPLNIKNFNTNISPTITTVNGLKKYHWQTINPTPFEYEDGIPANDLVYQNVCVSDYKNWKEVIDWGTKVYTIKDPLSAKLKQEINTINASNYSEGEKIKATLNFVQDEIRYLGLEDGIGAYKPFTPNKVLEQRYGDCKDKSLLMVTMLNAMGIEAYPVLIGTRLKQTLTQILPSPKFFDHCVVKVVENNGRELWYDPTISNQGGSYKTTYFPDYRYALVLKPGNTNLEEVVTNATNKITTKDEFILDDNDQSATLNITTIYNESEADNIRNYFKSNSLNTIAKEYEAYYSKLYKSAKLLKNPEITDNIGTNTFIVKESYKIDSIWEPLQEKKNFIGVNFYASNLYNILGSIDKNKRAHNLSLAYPIAREHHIKVKLPDDNWDIENDSELINSKAFYYDLDIKYNKSKNEINLKHYLKVQKNKVTPSEYKQYKKDVNKLDEISGYYIYKLKSKGFNTSSLDLDIDTDDIAETTGNFFKNTFLIIFIVVALIALALLGAWYFTQK